MLSTFTVMVLYMQIWPLFLKQQSERQPSLVPLPSEEEITKQPTPAPTSFEKRKTPEDWEFKNYSTSTSDENMPSKETKTKPSFRICQTESLVLPTKDQKSTELPVYFQCRGEAYEKFGEDLREYAEETKKGRELWGSRPFPMPPNKKVLMIGNSHTRQTAKALACQYAKEISMVDQISGTESAFYFSNNSTMYLVENSPLVYSTSWPTLLEENVFRHHSFSSIDAIVLGSFNNYNPSVKNSFQSNMLELSETRSDIDFKHVRAPEVSEVMRRYDGPILALSMFAEYSFSSFKDTFDASVNLQKANNRTNVVFLSGRKHIDKLGECGSDGKTEVGVCLMANDTSKYGRAPPDMHRCTGPHGGHPDLIAWDVIGVLYRFL